MRFFLNKFFIVSYSLILTACWFLGNVHQSVHGWEKKSLKCIKKYEYWPENKIDITINYNENTQKKEYLFFDLHIVQNQIDSISFKLIPYKYDEFLSNTFVIIERKNNIYQKFKLLRVEQNDIDALNNAINKEHVNLELRINLKKGDYRAKILSGFYRIYSTIPVLEKRCKTESNWEYFSIIEPSN